MKTPTFELHTAIRCALAGAALSILSGPVAAQQGALEEITVTAQRRAERLQDVPIAVTALTAQALENKAINDVSQLTNLVPNVNLDNNSPFSGSTSVLAAYIRGIGQNDFAFNFDPGVGIYLDGVYLARTVGANVDMLDVERIEVLKGPQGTLFGRNSVGGAINIVTRQPGDEFDWKAEVTAGDYHRMDVRGSADLPFIPDRLTSSISFSSKYRDGFQRRIEYPIDDSYVTDGNQFLWAGYRSHDREGGQDEQNVRLKLLWTPNDDVDVTLAADYTNVDQSASANTLIATDLSVFAGFYNLCINTPADVLNTVPDLAPFNTIDGVCGPRGVPEYPAGVPQGTPRTALGGVNADDDPTNNRLPYGDHFLTGNIDTTYSTANSFSKVKVPGLSLTVDWDIGDFGTLKSITAYRELEWSVGMDLDGSPIEMLQTSFDMTQHQVSQEFQLSGLAFGDKLNWLVGAYYFKEGGWLFDYVTFPGGLLQIYGPNDLQTEAYAGFVHLNYSLTEKLGITLGARYTKEDKEFEGFQHDLNAFNYKIAQCFPPLGPSPVPGQNCQELLGFPDPDDFLRYFPPGMNKKSFDDISPRVGFEFRPSDEVMFYASYSEGFKSGSWTTRLSNPLPEAPDFDQEEATSYEVGVKSELFDRRVILNAAAFFTDYENIQLNFQEGVSPTFKNAGDAELKGGEVEFTGLLTDSFTLSAAVGYLDAEYTSIDPGALGVTLDSSLPKTPEWTAVLSPRYVAGLGNGGALAFNVDFSYRSEVYNDTENTELLRRPSTENLNASIVYTEPDGKWDLGFGGTNLTDDRYLITGQAQFAGGQVYGTYNRPREWWVTVRVRH